MEYNELTLRRVLGCFMGLHLMLVTWMGLGGKYDQDIHTVRPHYLFWFVLNKLEVDLITLRASLSLLAIKESCPSKWPCHTQTMISCCSSQPLCRAEIGNLISTINSIASHQPLHFGSLPCE